MLNPTDASPAAALSFPLQGPFQMSQMPSDSPLTKLMEHCNKFGTGMDNKMKLEPVKTDSLLLPTDMNAYSSYLSPQNWWVDQANWQHFYPSVTAADTFPYLSPASLGLLSSSVAAQSAAALSTQSPLATAMATQNRNPVKRVTASSASASSNSSSGNAAGGRYQAARAPNKCECPNCQELERLGSNMNDKNKVGKHNCHIAGCGKIYGKSSHLKAHLRWHSGERQVNRKQI